MAEPGLSPGPRGQAGGRPPAANHPNQGEPSNLQPAGTPREQPEYGGGWATGSGDAGRSRVTALARLLLAATLLWTAGQVLNDPAAGAEVRGGRTAVVLPLAGVYFAIGMFLLAGFMSRLAGLFLVFVAIWDLASLGFAALPLVYILAGVYLMVRGGGAWAMDRYVGAMQDRVRQREKRAEAEKAAARRRSSETDGI